ncbi:MAG: Rad52/Rad22 family DNA repair protein, partial [Gemmatimonadaceae bacterium]
VRDRLDTVVPGEWDLTLEMLPGIAGNDDSDSVCAFKARLQVLGVIREDVGTGRDYKQASTDAFKRAAVRFGIGHELYAYEQNWVEVDGDGKYAKPVDDPAHAYERRHGSGTTAGSVAASGSGHSAKSAVATDTAAVPQYSQLNSNVLTDVDSVSCPKCGGRTWDNRLTKRNPKAPDYKCRDRNCEGVVWPARQNGAGSGTGSEHMGDAEEAGHEPAPIAAPAGEKKAREPRAAAAASVGDDDIPF